MWGLSRGPEPLASFPLTLYPVSPVNVASPSPGMRGVVQLTLTLILPARDPLKAWGWGTGLWGTFRRGHQVSATNSQVKQAENSQ